MDSTHIYHPVEVATVGGRARILGAGLGQVFELGAELDLGDQGLGLVFLLHQDVAGAVFIAAVGGLELLVLGLCLGVGDRVLLGVVGEQLADQQALACQLHLGLVVGGRGDAATLGFLHEDLAQDDLVLDLRLQLRRARLAGLGDLAHQQIDAGLGHGLAVDGGEVLRTGRQRHKHSGQGRDGGGEHKLLHGSGADWRVSDQIDKKTAPNG